MQLSTTDQSLPAEKSAAWRRVRFWTLVVLLNHRKPHLRWQWAVAKRDGRKALQLVSPRGLRWDFRLNQGAWLRLVKPENKNKT